jgi:hypothetical protein
MKAKAVSTILFLIWLLVIRTIADTAEATVSQLLMNPTKFDGQHVTVSGTAQYVRPKTSRRGNDYETFSLCYLALRPPKMA